MATNKINEHDVDHTIVTKAEANSIKLISLLASGWSANAPYTQTVTVNGMKDTDSPIPLFVDDSTTESERKAKQKAYGFISYFDSGDNSVTVTCKYKKPETNFSVGLKGV